MAGLRRHKLSIGLGTVAVVIVLIVLFWDWNWFRPMVEARASAALGRKVTIGRLHVRLGGTTQVTLDDVTVNNPAGFVQAPPFATIAHLRVRAGVWDYLFHRRLVLPLIDFEQPQIDARQEADGRSNWALGGPGGRGGAAPEIGDLRIVGGNALVRSPKLRANFAMTLATQAPGSAPQDAGNPDNQIIVTANGTYAGQPIVGKFVGGALLSLRQSGTPYPIDLALANGATTISLKGTVRDPLHLAGADLRLVLAGKDMAALYPLTGIAIPQTPPYHISGQLDYADHRIRFRDFAGTVGKSDLEGSIAVDPRPSGPRPLVVADLRSRSVDLDDLAGFIGGTPGNKTTPGQTAAQKAQLTRAADSTHLLPTTPISLPKLKAADVSLRYRGGHIQGRYMPFDDIVVALDIDDGDIRLHPLDFAIGHGTLVSNISLRDVDERLYTKADVTFDRIDLGRIMQATHSFSGGGTIGGGARLDTTGNSLSAMLGNGNGGMEFNMASAGDLSALLQDLSGLQFGDALLSALGIPNKAQIRCLRSAFTLTDGVMTTDVFALDTTEAVTRGKGSLDFKSETLKFQLQTRPVHFSIGTLHAPIDIDGTLKHPSILPNIATLAARGGAAIGLGILFPPLALLPTIQLGVGKNTDCQKLAQGGIL